MTKRSEIDDHGVAGIEPLALRPKEAAKALGISERLLWSKTNAGDIPHLRLGRAVIYPTEQLRQWLAEQAKGHAIK